MDTPGNDLKEPPDSLEGEQQSHDPSVVQKGLKRLIVTPTGVNKLTFFPFSAVMPESTRWEAHMLPRCPKQADTWNVLLVLGNVAHLAGDMPLKFWEDALQLPDWHFLVYVPGPYDYGSGTLELGDSFLKKLHFLDRRLAVFSFGSPLTSVYFTGPRVLMRGAACWPIEPIHYQDARVYQRRFPCADEPTQDEALTSVASQGDEDAIMDCLWVTRERAQYRLGLDVQQLLSQSDARAQAHVIVSFGCPDEMASASRKKSPFHATVSLGDAKTYARFSAIGAAYWFCGAPTDTPSTAMYKSNTKLCSNCYIPGGRKLPSTQIYVLGSGSAAAQ